MVTILKLMTPKSELAYLFDDYSLRQALEKMRYHGYAAIPVINREGEYVTTVSEGDFLWYLLDEQGNFNAKKTEDMELKSILKQNKYSAFDINSNFQILLEACLEQNFVPLVDDRKMLIGIVTRKALLSTLK